MTNIICIRGHSLTSLGALGWPELPSKIFFFADRFRVIFPLFFKNEILLKNRVNLSQEGLTHGGQSGNG